MARRQGRGTDPSNHGGERCAMIDNAKPTAGLALVVLLVAAASSAAAAAPHYQAEIRRTAYGIPHIRAQDEASLGFGMGYAYAQDNLCMLADEMVTVNSRRSEFFGPELIAGPDIDSGYTHSRSEEHTSELQSLMRNSYAVFCL